MVRVAESRGKRRIAYFWDFQYFFRIFRILWIATRFPVDFGIFFVFLGFPWYFWDFYGISGIFIVFQGFFSTLKVLHRRL